MPLVYNYKPSRDCYVVSGQNYIEPSVNGIPTVYDDGVNGTKNVKEIADFGFSNRNNIEAVIIPSGIDYIGVSAFRNCAGLKNLFILDSSLIIDNQAFQNCTNLTGLFFGSGLRQLGIQSFNNVTNLQTLNLPNSLTGIGSGCFQQCQNIIGSNLTGLTDFLYLPINLRDLGARAFAGCSSIKEVRIPSSQVKFIDRVFLGCTQLRYCIFNVSGITGFGGPLENTDFGDFENCINLRTFKFPVTCSGMINARFFTPSQYLEYVGIPSGIKNIRTLAFFNTPSLKRVDMPDNLESIGEQSFAFSNGGDNNSTTISNIFEITGVGTGMNDPVATSVISKPFSLPTGLLTIGSLALNVMPLQESFTLPEKVNILANPFSSNINLVNIDVAPNNPYITGISGLLYNKAGNALIFCPTFRSGIVEVPAGTTNLNSRAFKSCRLTGIKLPTSLTSIGDECFQFSSLQEIDIPNSVVFMGTYFEFGIGANLPFAYCPELKKISFPQNTSYTTILKGFLRDNVSLEYVNIPDTIVNTQDEAFANCFNLKKIDIGTGLSPRKKTIHGVGGLLGFNRPATFSFVRSPSPLVTYPAPATYALTGVCVSSDNPNILDISGIVYTKNSGELIYYPPGRIAIDNYHVPGNTYSPPDHVTGIWNRAFLNSTNLQKVYIKNNIRFVGATDFPPSYFGDSPPISVSHVFRNCTGLKEIIFSDCVVEIAALENNPYLTGIIFEETGNCFLSGNSNFINVGISNFYIPSGLSGVNSQTFSSATGLSGVTVHPMHPSLSSVDGILYNKAQNQIIIFPPNLLGDIFIPDSITGINDNLFHYSKISSLKIGTGIQTIGKLFLQSPNLTGVMFGDSVHTFRTKRIIENCPNLREIYFGKSTKYFNSFPFSETEYPFFGDCPNLNSIIYPTGDFIFNHPNTNNTGKFLETLFLPVFFSPGPFRNIRLGIFTLASGPFGGGPPPYIEQKFLKITRYSVNENNKCVVNYIDYNYNNNYSLGVGPNTANIKIEIPTGINNREVDLLSGISNISGVFSKNDIYTKDIIIPSGVKVVDNINISFGLSGLIALTGVSAHNSSPYISSDKGILYNKNKTQIIGVPVQFQNGDLCLDTNLISISSEAFAYNQNITGINFKGDAPQIGQNIFTGANSNLKIYRKKYAKGFGEYLQDRKTYYKSDNIILTNGPVNKFNIFTGENGKMTTFYTC